LRKAIIPVVILALMVFGILAPVSPVHAASGVTFDAVTSTLCNPNGSPCGSAIQTQFTPSAGEFLYIQAFEAVFCAENTACPVVTAISDTQGNTFVSEGSIQVEAYRGITIFYVKSTLSASTDTVTVTWANVPASMGGGIAVARYTGVVSIGAFQTATSTTTTPTVSITVQQSSAVLAISNLMSIGAGNTITPGGTQTQRAFFDSTGSGQTLHGCCGIVSDYEDFSPGASGATSVSATVGTSGNDAITVLELDSTPNLGDIPLGSALSSTIQLEGMTQILETGTIHTALTSPPVYIPNKSGVVILAITVNCGFNTGTTGCPGSGGAFRTNTLTDSASDTFTNIVTGSSGSMNGGCFGSDSNPNCGFSGSGFWTGDVWFSASPVVGHSVTFTNTLSGSGQSSARIFVFSGVKSLGNVLPCLYGTPAINNTPCNIGGSTGYSRAIRAVGPSDVLIDVVMGVESQGGTDNAMSTCNANPTTYTASQSVLYGCNTFYRGGGSRIDTSVKLPSASGMYQETGSFGTSGTALLGLVDLIPLPTTVNCSPTQAGVGATTNCQAVVTSAGQPTMKSVTNAGWSDRGICTPCSMTVSGITVAAGDIIIGTAGGFQVGVSSQSASDSLSDSYTRLIPYGSEWMVIYATASSASSSFSVTYSWNQASATGRFQNFYVEVYTNTIGIGNSCSSGQAGTSPVSCSFTPQSSNSLIFDSFSAYGGASCNGVMIASTSETNTRVTDCNNVGSPGPIQLRMGEQSSLSSVTVQMTASNSPTAITAGGIELLSAALPTGTVSWSATPSPLSIGFVGSASGSIFGGQHSSTINYASQTGNTIIVIAYMNGANCAGATTCELSSVTDTAGDTFTELVRETNGPNDVLTMWATSGGGSHASTSFTLTINSAGGTDFISAVVGEYSKIGSFGATNKVTSGVTTSSSSSITQSLSASSDFAICGLSFLSANTRQPANDIGNFRNADLTNGGDNYLYDNTGASSVTCSVTENGASRTNGVSVDAKPSTVTSGTFSPTSCTLTTTNAPANTEQCTSNYTPSVVGTGTHTITGTYNGNANYPSSSGSTSITVTKGAATISITCGGSSTVKAGSPVTCTATVSGGGATPTGTVSFTTNQGGVFNPSNGQCTLSGGTCTVQYTPNTITVHTITATFSGDTNYFASGSGSNTATFSMSVFQAPSIIVASMFAGMIGLFGVDSLIRALKYGSIPEKAVKNWITFVITVVLVILILLAGGL